MEWIKNHKLISGIVGIVLIAGIASAAGTSEPNTSNSTSNNSSQSSEETGEDTNSSLAGLNETARDGKFEFTAKSLKCGETVINGDFSNEQAQGQFCRLVVDVKNIGNEGQGFSNSDQLLISDTGAQFKEASGATIIVQDDYYVFETINPGNSLKGVEIIYDVPKDANITMAEFHDSAFSGGVEVNLK